MTADAATLRRRFRLWLAGLALMLLLALQQLPDMRVQGDVLAMLPGPREDVALHQALAGFSDRAARSNLVLIGAADAGNAHAAATAFAQTLRDSPAISRVQLDAEADVDAQLALLLPHRSGLLTDADRAQLATLGASDLADRALRELMSPAGLARVVSPARDPLGWLNRYWLDSLPVVGAARLRDGVLMLEADGKRFVVLAVELREGPFAMDGLQPVAALLQRARAAATAAGATEIVSSGVFQHAAAAADTAHREISWFGGLSMLALLSILLLVFKSPLPLLLTLFTIALGIVAGLSVSLWVFGEIYLVTLVFGTSLIGIAEDYAMHFFAELHADPAGAQAAAAISQRLQRPLMIGVLTTLTAFAGLAMLPYPALRQMAVFSIVGLAVAALTVVLAYPWLLQRLTRRPAQSAGIRGLSLATALLRRSQLGWRGRGLFLLGCGVLVVLGGSRLQFDDRVSQLQASPPEVMAQERRVHDLLGQSPDSRVLVAQADSPQALLELLEAVEPQLQALRADGAVQHWTSLAQALPSLRRQRENRALLAPQLGDGGALEQVLSRLGASAAQKASTRLEWGLDAPLLELDTWLSSPASAPYRMLWLGALDGRWSAVIVLHGIADAAALQALAEAVPGLRWIDRLHDISTSLRAHREATLQMLGGGLLLLLCVLLLRYGVVGALAVGAPAVLGCALALAVLGLAGVNLNLFSILALLLVLGIGVDFGVFMREAGEQPSATVLAVMLSALTTQLSFGMLALSATPFIRAIGLPLAIGIAVALVVAVLLRPAAAAIDPTSP